MQVIRIGTRGSKLALWQANHLKSSLEALGYSVELCIIKTKGDQIQHLGFDKLEGKGFFTKEIEDALLLGEIDIAVHSMKDMPTTQPEGLVLTAVSKRANPADMLIIKKTSIKGSGFLGLGTRPVIGTSSARRKAQTRHLMPDCHLKDIRGNVPTRLRKLKEGDFDAILLAAAGIERLQIDLKEFKHFTFDTQEFVPAPAQGVMVYQTLENDFPMRRILKEIHAPQTSRCTNIERRVLQLAEGGCHVPLGVHCTEDSLGNYHVIGAYAKSWDAPVRYAQLSSATSYNLAEMLWERLSQ